MKYNSIHRFDNVEDARLFIAAITSAGFKHKDDHKDGGVIYSNLSGHEMLIYVC